MAPSHHTANDDDLHASFSWPNTPDQPHALLLVSAERLVAWRRAHERLGLTLFMVGMACGFLLGLLSGGLLTAGWR